MSFRSVSLTGNRYAPGSMGFEKDINVINHLLLCMHTLELATPNHDLREPHGPIGRHLREPHRAPPRSRPQARPPTAAATQPRAVRR